jgi:hypothetical protein
MAIQIHTGRLEFPPGAGLRSMDDARNVQALPANMWVAMSGYQVRYDGGDNHVRQLRVELSTSSGVGEFGPVIYVTARLHLRDNSDTDSFSGWVSYILFVDTGDGRPDRPRDPLPFRRREER